MHELSIAINIVEIATAEAINANADSVLKIELEIGRLAGVLPDALELAMNEAVKNSILENAEVKFNYIDGQAVCQDCCHEFETNDYFKPCPVCNSTNNFLVRGKELNIKSMDIEQSELTNY